MDRIVILQVTYSPLVQRLIKIPTAEEWERFKTYTRRVVELHVGGTFGWGVSSETISFLGMQSAVDPLWAGLTSLRLHEPGWETVAFALAFLSPKIQVLSLILPRDTSILLHPILSVASDRCHSIQKLVLDIVVDDSHSAHKVGGLISACRDTLRILDIRSPYRTEYLPIIADLPQLRVLCIERARFLGGVPFDCFPALEEFTFPHLQEYQAGYSQGCQIGYFLKRLGTRRLKVAKIYSTATVGFEELVRGLSRFSTSLRDLEITAITSLNLPSYPCCRLPVMSLRNVQLWCLPWEVTSHKPCPLLLSDETVAKLGAVMPNLTHLTLGNPTCPELQCITFLSLVSLSETCRNLETLEIKVDLRTMVAPPLSVSESKSVGTGAISDKTGDHPCKLRRLVVGSSTLPDLPESGWIVTAGLRGIFPSLREVEGCGPGRSKWEQVCENIRMFRQVLRTVGSLGA